jgi:hypothetical protein
MKAIVLPLAGIMLATGCSQSEQAFVDNLVRQAVSNTGEAQQVAMTRQGDSSFSGTATVRRRADGQSIRFNCTARRQGNSTNYEALCLQEIDQQALDELEANMRRSLEAQRLTVSEIEFTRQDENNVTGFAQVSDPATGESARLVCTGARPSTGGRIEASCNVPGGPAAGAAPPAAEEPAAAPAEQAPAE